MLHLIFTRIPFTMNSKQRVAFRSYVIMSLTIFLYTAVQGQIVNMENNRIHSDSARIAGYANLGFHYTNNNNNRLLVTRNALMLQLKSRDYRDLWLAMVNFDLSRANDKAFTRAGFGHLRYNRKLTKILRWEAFAQLQHNRVLGIQNRLLLGTGSRLKFNLKEGKSQAYWGLSAMLEQEETAAVPPVLRRDGRWSTYLSSTIELPRWLPGEWIMTTYYQPRMDLLADYRVSHESSVELAVSARIRVTFRYTFLYDSQPPAGISLRAQAFEQGFRFRW
jgi:hypothetical protein